MSQPILQLTPLRSAVCSDAPIHLDVLVSVTAPQPEVHFVRQPLNLALVLDRSGSMASGKKLAHAREAAVFAVEQLLPTDRVSVTVFDAVAQLLVPSTLATDKAGIIRAIREVTPGSTTALHAAWKMGAEQVLEHRREGGMNRVLLLSDGLANVGLSDPNAIATEVQGMAARGVGTTTLGVGDDYNEDMMEAMARGGQGNYYFIDDPAQLADIFQTELHDLMALAGWKVSLGIEPGEGVRVAEMLNDLDVLPTGRWKLPNLVVAMPATAVARLAVAPRPGRGLVASVRVAWDPPKGGPRGEVRARLDLPAVSKANWDILDQAPEVVEAVGLLMSARARREAARAAERGDLRGSANFLREALCCTAALPESTQQVEDLAAIARLREDLEDGKLSRLAKRAKQQHYGRSHGHKLS